jgi:hypothetical protein
VAVCPVPEEASNCYSPSEAQLALHAEVIAFATTSAC